MKEVLYEVRCLKSTEDMILALAGQFKQLSHDFKHRKFLCYFPCELLDKRTIDWNGLFGFLLEPFPYSSIHIRVL